jgi:hypothetical protein
MLTLSTIAGAEQTVLFGGKGGSGKKYVKKSDNKFNDYMKYQCYNWWCKRWGHRKFECPFPDPNSTDNHWAAPSFNSKGKKGSGKKGGKKGFGRKGFGKSK